LELNLTSLRILGGVCSVNMLEIAVRNHCKVVDRVPPVMRESHILNDCFPSEDMAVIWCHAARSAQTHVPCHTAA
jgi:hypothetical protein